MKHAAIIVEDLWKRYQLGDIGAGNLKEAMQGWWDRRILGKALPAADGLTGDNDLSGTNPTQDFWALKNISFEVTKGEVFGIIGKNGAGKSTLLKLLSRISRPTRGVIRGTGTIASLLEVGTGFHEELTGRENIFLNGNILGMSNREIRGKFDAIVDFSGISKFIDTPVKRYSSGMYVRLAFAVAAHLNPDILVLDEVLSVGDTEFQEKCLTAIQELAGSGDCTVIYVSHNLSSVLQLCNRAMLLHQGQMATVGLPRQVVDTYFKSMGKLNFHRCWENPGEAPGNEIIRMKKVALTPELSGQQRVIDVRTPLHIHFEFRNLSPGIDLSVGIHLFTGPGECVFDVPSASRILGEGDYAGSCTIPGHFLNDGAYYISIIFVKNTLEQVYYLEKCLAFEIADHRGTIQWKGKWMGAVRPQFPIQIVQKNSDVLR
jgi:lipopolysaccharide transport system ATP-binding protein